MSTPRWELFAAAALLVALALVVLSRATARVVTGDDGPRPPEGGAAPSGPAAGEEPTASEQTRPVPPMPTGVALLANVALTHGLMGVVVFVLAWYAALPWAALGLGSASLSTVGLGLVLGVGLYAASEAAAAVADRLGVEYDERLRELLAPGSPGEWALMLLVILPIVAGAEELLFRGALIGALAYGFDLPVAALVVGSSILFGAGHSAQGGLGVVATAAMGLVLGTAFVVTGSLAVVVVAHYAVNALEFVVEEARSGWAGWPAGPR